MIAESSSRLYVSHSLTQQQCWMKCNITGESLNLASLYWRWQWWKISVSKKYPRQPKLFLYYGIKYFCIILQFYLCCRVWSRYNFIVTVTINICYAFQSILYCS